MNSIKSFYKGKRVLITGHNGFKGTWMCQILKDCGANVIGYSLEPTAEPSLYDITNMSNDIWRRSMRCRHTEISQIS